MHILGQLNTFLAKHLNRHEVDLLQDVARVAAALLDVLLQRRQQRLRALEDALHLAAPAGSRPSSDPPAAASREERALQRGAAWADPPFPDLLHGEGVLRDGERRHAPDEVSVPVLLRRAAAEEDQLAGEVEARHPAREQARVICVGFGRTVVSATETPILLVNLV